MGDILDCPLAEVQNTNAACVLGVELADLVEDISRAIFGKGFFAERMLSKCTVVKEKFR